MASKKANNQPTWAQLIFCLHAWETDRSQRGNSLHLKTSSKAELTT